MIKRFLLVISVVILLSPLLASHHVHADVVYGNDFFWENRDKTEPIWDNWPPSKGFIVNSPLGYVIPKEEPGSDKGIPTYLGYRGMGDENATMPTSDVWIFNNGETVYVNATYLHNGEYWGNTEPSHMYKPSGWVLMDELLMLYTRQDFESENKDSIYTYSGDCEVFFPAGRLVVWQWPGSDREKRIIDKEEATNLCAGNYYLYMDQKGREWVTYAGGWVCLNDPANSKIPSFYPAPEPIRWSPGGGYDWSAGNPERPPYNTARNASRAALDALLLATSFLVIIILATLIVVISVPIAVFRKSDINKS